MKRKNSSFCAIITILTISASVQATDWPQWRGPFFNGATDETNLPDSWGETENIAWVSPLPGPSGATAIISNGKVFVSSMIERGPGFVALCLDARDGKKLWEKQIGSDSRRFPRNNMASPSPVADGEEFKIIFETKIDETPIQSSISIADGHLFIRTAKNLYCIGK